MRKTIIIGEAGVNHNGDIGMAKELIEIAAESEVDYVKFQTFQAIKIVTKDTPQAQYQMNNLASSDKDQFNMLKNLELKYEDHYILKEFAEKKGIGFLSSPFDIESARFLLKLGQDFIKLPSGEITNIPMLRYLSNKNKRVILSSGMATLGEIENAIRILKDGGTKRDNIIVLHCNSAYPTPFNDVNLLAMNTISSALKVRVGFSDHTLGIEVPVAAVALGAEIVEKHFTIDKTLVGPDHKASLEPTELKQMVKSIRNVEKSLGSGIKEISISERENIRISRKKIIAKEKIDAGEVLNEENITLKRSEVGIGAENWDLIVGSISKKSYLKDEPI